MQAVSYELKIYSNYMYICMNVCMYVCVYVIKTHSSELRGQEEAGCNVTNE